MGTSRQEKQWVLRAQCHDREALEELLRSVQPKGALLLATFALAMTVFGGVFMLVLHITRMTQRILQAIEVASKG